MFTDALPVNILYVHEILSSWNSLIYATFLLQKQDNQKRDFQSPAMNTSRHF